MTSSSSATSCNSCADGGRNGDVTFHGEPQQHLRLNNGKYTQEKQWAPFESTLLLYYFCLAKLKTKRN